MDSFSVDNLQMQPGAQNPPLNKMDILFYQSVTRLQRSYSIMAVYHFMKALLFIIFVPINYTIISHPNDPDILAVMVYALVVSVLQMVSVMLFRMTTLKDSQLLLRIAHQMQHMTHQPITSSIDSLQNCVSETMFNQHNGTLLTNEGITNQIKNMYLNYLTPNLKQILLNNSPVLKIYDNFAEFLGFVSFIVSIVTLSRVQSNSSQFAVIVLYIVLEGLNKLLVILIGVLIALSPFFCVIMIFYICCCGRGEDQGDLKLPNVQKATQKIILEADGNCSICYQNFMVDQSVIRLKCSSKHMFHVFCISGWTKIKETCPICRASLRDSRNNYQQNQ